jgi:putative restriction endonuclease
MAEQTLTAPADRELFSLHPEDDMTERRSHSAQAGYFDFAFSQVLPGMFVARNLAVYWVPGQRKYPYAGPDVLVSRHHPPDPDPTVYLTYEEGPLTLVVEIASLKTRRREKRRRDEVYAATLQVPVYLFVDIPRHILDLRELVAGKYEPVPPDSEGRYWSRELGIGFVWQADGKLVRVLTPDGRIVPTAQEEADLRAAAEERAEAERARAEAEHARAEAERERAEAERARAEALAVELERLRRMLGEEA